MTALTVLAAVVAGGAAVVKFSDGQTAAGIGLTVLALGMVVAWLGYRGSEADE